MGRMPDSFFSQLRKDPATTALMSSLGSFASAQVGRVATKAAGSMSGDTPATGAVKGAAGAAAEGKSAVLGGITGAIKGLFKRGGSAKRPTNIYEQLFIGVPVDQAYENWTEYSKFPEYMKGPESVKVTEEEGENGEIKQTHQWTAKIFLNRRSWKATVEEDVENRRIRWSTEAAKGTIDGVVTFTPIGDQACLMVYVLEYRPKGFFEWWGNRWRTVGRRARLDVKHFGRYVMMQDQSEENEDVPDADEHDDEAEEQSDQDEDLSQLNDNEDEEEEDDGKPKKPKPPEFVKQVPRARRTPRSPRD